MNTWEHYVGDGRGRRKVLLDGKELDCVIGADTKRGAVLVAEVPIRVIEGEIATVELQGVVEVVPL